MIHNGVLNRRRFLTITAAVTARAFLGAEPVLATSEDEKIKELMARSAVEIYQKNAAYHKVYLKIPDISAQGGSFVTLRDQYQYWGVVDGNEIIEYVQEAPLFSAVANEFGLAHPPIELLSDDENAPILPGSFEYKGTTWWYEEDVSTENIGIGKRFILANDEGVNFGQFSRFESLSDAVANTDWSQRLLELDAETRQLFEVVRESKLFKTDSVRFIFPDGFHPSHPPSQLHEVYDADRRGVGDTRISGIPRHPMATPSGSEILLGTEIKHLTMEKDDLILKYIPERWAHAKEARESGQVLSLDIVNNPFDIIDNDFLTNLERLVEEEGIDLEVLNVLFMISTSNDNEVLNIPVSLRKFVLAVTSSENQAGIILPEKAKGQLFEFPESVPALEALPIIVKSSGTETIEWKFTPTEVHGVSYSCLHLSLLAGVITSVLSSKGEQPTSGEVLEIIFEICPLIEKSRNGIAYQVRVFNFHLFKKFVDNTLDIYLPWIDTGDQLVVITP
jgi:hypothetical protein